MKNLRFAGRRIEVSDFLVSTVDPPTQCYQISCDCDGTHFKLGP